MIRKHKTLNKKLWKNPEQLKDNISDLMITAVWDFIDYVRCKYDMDIRNQDIKDIILYGSNANYFYNNKSDIDICILLDTKTLEQLYPNLSITKQLKLYYYDWTMFHKFKIGKYGIALYFTSIDSQKFGDRYCIGPNYSVLNDKWLFKPVIISDIEWKQIKTNSKKIYKEFMRDYKNVKKNGFKTQDVTTLFYKIIMDKVQAVRIHYKQPMSPIYVAYKKIKHKHLNKMLSDVLLKEENKFTLK